ncbi:truncated basic helix-loop-helix protein A [Selaginella moellendorffii]|uniref:truncated basic helix-loop-helix protein A n=1 Tax=Selaginella moellendorffii TaxID=88036 RepID=UPI000D1D1184|nr:truncated basic helix-loop-helix protein A [Selaginella moellendorffii]|eukprot:XP_002983169.2 truncated basic helix-loop-helix protein A [Selaginella moellendorffii]
MPTKFSGARSALCELHDLCHPEEDYREVDHVTDQEWFYLLSKSWNFACGEGIPGRAFQFGQHIWICDTVKPINFHCARLELAKSAGIQTIVCIKDGVSASAARFVHPSHRRSGTRRRSAAAQGEER